MKSPISSLKIKQRYYPGLISLRNFKAACFKIPLFGPVFTVSINRRMDLSYKSLLKVENDGSGYYLFGLRRKLYVKK